MTIVEAPELEIPALDGEGEEPAVPSSEPEPASTEGETSIVLTGIATFLAVAAAGWMAAGVFRGALPRAVGIAGALIGVGSVIASYRTRRPSVVQYLALPATLAAGAVLVLPFAKGGSANLPSLVAQAIRSGGISQPPVPFDPGWRFLLLVIIAVVGIASASLATGLSKPKLGIVLPAPVVFAAALVQPAGSTLVSSVVALVLLIGAFGVSFGVDLARDTSASGGFELRRLGRAAGVGALVVVAVVVLAQLGFLLPKSNQNQVIPPKRPQVPPAQPDRVLFTYTADRQLPIRLGVLDVYRTVAWLTPPFDSRRLQKIPSNGTVVPGAKPGDVKAGEMPGLRAAPANAGPDVSVTFTIADLPGHIIPDVQNPQRVEHHGTAIQIDPRTQTLRLPDLQAQRGLTYTVVTRDPPDAQALRSAGAPPASMSEYLQVPAAPPGVAALLAQAPTSDAFDRLQYVRNAYYQKVVAAGAGNPVDVPPARVDQMLQGKPASPYEITAAEVLLARWAGIPARIGFGYFGGERAGASDTYSIRPEHGATWLEAYFDGYGWIPIVGIPPKAQASITPSKKHQDPTIRPTQDIALLVYVPVRAQTFEALYQKVRYWGLRALPWVVLVLLVAGFYPALLKAARRVRRRRWAAGRPRQRIAVAYAELRDMASDFNMGVLTLTPLEFLDVVADDAEHRELAWLVTRALWGDLTRDLRAEDAEEAETMAASVARRLRKAESGLSRAVALGSRASLREPYATEVPNLWPRIDARGVLRKRPQLIPGAAALLLIVGVLASCGTAPPAVKVAPLSLPAKVAPASLDGLTFKRELAAEGNFARAGKQALVAGGQVYSLHSDAGVEASLQVEAFKPGFGARPDVTSGVLKSLNAPYQLTRIGALRVYVFTVPDQQLMVYFAPGGKYLDILVARADYTGPNQLIADVIAYQQGLAPGASRQLQVTPPPDPRRVTSD